MHWEHTEEKKSGFKKLRDSCIVMRVREAHLLNHHNNSMWRKKNQISLKHSDKWALPSPQKLLLKPQRCSPPANPHFVYQLFKKAERRDARTSKHAGSTAWPSTVQFRWVLGRGLCKDSNREKHAHRDLFLTAGEEGSSRAANHPWFPLRLL